MEASLPAAYCDTSFILEYWEANIEYEETESYKLQLLNRPKHLDFLKDLLKSEYRHEKPSLANLKLLNWLL
jgi:hypothetical protein